MVNNVQTVEQWQQVLTTAQETRRLAEVEAHKSYSALEVAKADVNRATYAQAISPNWFTSKFYGYAYDVLQFAKADFKDAQALYNADMATLKKASEAVTNAEQQIELAKSGPSNTNSTPQPAGASTNANSEGSNTGVIVTPVPEPTAYTPQTITGTPTGGFEGNAIPANLATTIEYDNGTTTKTQVFGQGVVDVESNEDPVSQRADENAGFVFDPATGEMVPGDSSYAAELIEIDVLSDPLLTPDGEIEGDAGTGLEEPVEVDPENEPLRTPDGGIDDEGDAGTGLEEPPEVDPEDDPNVRAMEEASRQEAEDNFEFSDSPTEADVQESTGYNLSPKDWRVRISLAKNANYFYNLKDAGILSPLSGTNGVIFPYTPTISVTYNAKYDSQTITHSNYGVHTYTGSSVDQVQITGDFTAQNTTEAAYVLAVIHFFRSATKMFYGKDQPPMRGTPPPLLYLSGHGSYQFDNHPMVLTSFNYSLPTDVDYINAYPGGSDAINTVPLEPYNRVNTEKPSLIATGIQRLTGSGLRPGGTSKPPVFINKPPGPDVVTRVPTRISISLTFLPIVTRNAVTNHFSLKDYASGKLLRGSKNPGTGGGFW